MNDKASSAKGSEDPILQWVTFKLDNETYGINVMRVQEVLRYTEIAPVPGAPSYVLGIINLRGNVVTVIDTRQRFGLVPTEVNDNTRIVIIEADKQVVGILVDSVAEVVYLRQSEVETAPNVGNSAHQPGTLKTISAPRAAISPRCPARCHSPARFDSTVRRALSSGGRAATNCLWSTCRPRTTARGRKRSSPWATCCRKNTWQ